MTVRSVAADHQADQIHIATSAAQAIGDMWSEVSARTVVDTWTGQLPAAVATATTAQYAAAAAAGPYLDELADEPADLEVAPDGFAGHAADGRALASLLLQPALYTLALLGAGADRPRALMLGRLRLDMTVRSEIADAGRVADGVALAGRQEFGGYVRVLSPPSCSRCAILAGRFYRWNDGFLRHPRCDCRHAPARDPAAAHSLTTDPRRYFTSLGHAEQDRIFTRTGADAIRDGADIARLVNARRGMSTTVGQTGRRRLARARTAGRNVAITTEAASRGVRLMPESIYDIAGDDRGEAIRLLRAHGFLRGFPRPAVPPSRLELLPARHRAEGSFDGAVIEVERLVLGEGAGLGVIADRLRAMGAAAEDALAAALRAKDPRRLLATLRGMRTRRTAGKTSTATSTEDLSKSTVAQLRQFAKDRGIKLASRDRKADILAKLRLSTTGPRELHSLTVTELRNLARQNNIRLPAGLRKADIISELRVWEVGNSRSVFGGPLSRTKPTKAASVAPKASSLNPLELTGREDRWWILLREDTGMAPVPVRDLELVGGYILRSGRAYRIDGVTFIVEDGTSLFSDDVYAATQIVDAFRLVHGTLPTEAVGLQKGYAWLAGRNPADTYWEQRYGMPGFRSAATGGDGAVRMWDRRRSFTTPSVHSDTLRHEFGHNVSTGMASRGLHDRSPVWTNAAVSDQRTRRPSDLEFSGPGKSGHPIRLALAPTRPYPGGVTEYGTSSPGEDYAESVMLYLGGQIGTGRLKPGGPRVPIYFRDLFPARARILDDVFPSVARTQRAAVRTR